MVDLVVILLPWASVEKPGLESPVVGIVLLALHWWMQTQWWCIYHSSPSSSYHDMRLHVLRHTTYSASELIGNEGRTVLSIHVRHYKEERESTIIAFTHSLIGRCRSQCLLLIEPLDRRLKMIRYDKLSWWPEYAKVDSCQLEDTYLPPEKENTSFFLFKVRKQIVVLMLYMSGGGTDTIKKYWTASRAAEATAKPRCDSATPSTMPMHGQKAMRKLACHTMLRRLLLQPTLLLVS